MGESSSDPLQVDRVRGNLPTGHQLTRPSCFWQKLGEKYSGQVRQNKDRADLSEMAQKQSSHLMGEEKVQIREIKHNNGIDRERGFDSSKDFRRNKTIRRKYSSFQLKLH